MTLKVDGTNGVLQAYDYQTSTTGFSYTFAAGTQTLVINPAGTLATGTITMPASPADGMVVTVGSTQQITALTLQGNTGQSFTNGSITLRANQSVSFVYRLTNTTWYPFAGSTNSGLILGTSQASTSGTAIDFTSIPSWVKRITVMFNGVSTNGGNAIILQLGNGSFVTSGYVSSASYNGTSNGMTTATSGLLTMTGSSVANNYRGNIIVNLFGSNTWISSGMLVRDDGYINFGGGSIALSGTLDRLRITTVGGTDAFDAGSINILYE